MNIFKVILLNIIISMLLMTASCSQILREKEGIMKCEFEPPAVITPDGKYIAIKVKSLIKKGNHPFTENESLNVLNCNKSNMCPYEHINSNSTLQLAWRTTGGESELFAYRIKVPFATLNQIDKVWASDMNYSIVSCTIPTDKLLSEMQWNPTGTTLAFNYLNVNSQDAERYIGLFFMKENRLTFTDIMADNIISWLDDYTFMAQHGTNIVRIIINNDKQITHDIFNSEFDGKFIGMHNGELIGHNKEYVYSGIKIIYTIKNPEKNYVFLADPFIGIVDGETFIILDKNNEVIHEKDIGKDYFPALIDPQKHNVYLFYKNNSIISYNFIQNDDLNVIYDCNMEFTK